VRVIQRDVFSTNEDLRQDYQLILLSEVVSDFSDDAAIARSIRARYPVPGRRRSSGVQHLPPEAWIHPTRLPSNSDSSVTQPFSRNRKGRTCQKGPQTSWYADWVSGRDVFDLPREDCPIETHRLVYQKPAW
jgi:hypothetical protein